jgi:hypothetical protein
VLVGILVNLVVSSRVVTRIFLYRLWYAEKEVWRSFEAFQRNPTDLRAQNAFNVLNNMLQVTHLSVLLKNVKDVQVAEESEILLKLQPKSSRTLADIKARCIAVFRMLALQSFLSSFQEMPTLTEEELDGLKELLKISRRNSSGKDFNGKSADAQAELIQGLYISSLISYFLEKTPETLKVLGQMLAYSIKELDRSFILYPQKPTHFSGTFIPYQPKGQVLRRIFLAS